MSKILGTLLIGLMLMVSSGIVCAGPYEDARAAAERGDFATALRLWHLLAEQGNGNAQYNRSGNNVLRLRSSPTTKRVI
jgi:hypothetical protein